MAFLQRGGFLKCFPGVNYVNSEIKGLHLISFSRWNVTALTIFLIQNLYNKLTIF